jgi:hypothetical protein
VERRYSSISRTVRQPFEVGNEKVDAQYDKGVLTVSVPKPAEVQKTVRLKRPSADHHDMEESMWIEKPDLEEAMGVAGFLISYAFLLAIVLK